MTDWISQVEAAELLGVTPTSVYRMVSRGDLHPRPRHGMRPSLNRAEVLDLAQHRAEQAANKRKRADLRAAREAERRRTAGPPDTEHEWLTVREAAALLGVSQVAINKRCRRDRLPYVEHGGRRWLRRDLLELDQRARRAQAAGVVPYGYALHDASAEQRLAAFSLAETMGSTTGPRAARPDK